MGRIVIVPRGDETHQHLIPIFNPGGGASSLNSGPASGCVASLNDFAAWSGSLSTFDVNLPTKHQFMWSVRIERWIERNCHRHVLVSLGVYQSSFRLTFLDGQHKVTQFDKWWSGSSDTKGSPEFVLAFEDNTILLECIAWANENMLLGHQVVSNYTTIGVFIDDEKEAVHFKLRWADHIVA